MTSDLSLMTQSIWDALTPDQRAARRDNAYLLPQLIGLEGWRVMVIDHDGNSRRFIVGRSTGWRPCHIEVKKRTSMGGGAADSRGYQSVTKIERVR